MTIGQFIAEMRKNRVLFQALLSLKLNQNGINWQDIYNGIAKGTTRIDDYADKVSSWLLNTATFFVFCLHPQKPDLCYEDFSLYWLHQPDNNLCPCDDCEMRRMA